MFFTNCVLNSKSDEGEKITSLINKLYIITKEYPDYKVATIKTCLDCIEKNEKTLLAYKVIQKFLVDNDEVSKKIGEMLITNKINELYKVNFKRYKQNALEKAKNYTQDIDTLPIDNFTHSQNLRGRLEFINSLISANLWDSSEDPIMFLYNILIEKPISEKDKIEFFNWIMNLIENNIDQETEEKIYNIFNSKICKDQKCCQTLSIQAFESYLRIFLNINSRKNNINLTRNFAMVI